MRLPDGRNRFGKIRKRRLTDGDGHDSVSGRQFGNKPPQWLSTHPSDETRIANLQKLIPAMMPFGLADAFTSTLDARTIAKTFALYGDAVVRQLLRGKV